ncbi:MAG: hypothetical protein ACXWNL_16095 [Vulcanimicrobiaceae bacterium]
MTIETSTSYKADVKSRKLFGRMHAEIVALSKEIENLMTAANAMRLALGAATLTLAEVESLHVSQSHDKRTNDAMLFEAQSRLSEMLDAAMVKTLTAGGLLGKQVPKVEGLLAQAKRIADRDVVDTEPTGPVAGLAYVDAAYFRDQLGCSMSNVRYLMSTGAIPPHDSLSNDEGANGRPKLLWLKHKATVIVQGIKAKKGIAALV